MLNKKYALNSEQCLTISFYGSSHGMHSWHGSHGLCGSHGSCGSRGSHGSYHFELTWLARFTWFTRFTWLAPFWVDMACTVHMVHVVHVACTILSWHDLHGSHGSRGSYGSHSSRGLSQQANTIIWLRIIAYWCIQNTRARIHQTAKLLWWGYIRLKLIYTQCSMKDNDHEWP